MVFATFVSIIRTILLIFPYELVKEGKMTFRYEDLKAVLNNKKLIFTGTLVLYNFMVF